MTARTQREMEAASKQFAAAKLNSAKVSEESAKSMTVMAKKNADDATRDHVAAQSRYETTIKKVKEAELFLEKAEERLKVDKVDALAHVIDTMKTRATEGHRELEEARKRLAAAKNQASATAKALESAKQAEVLAIKTREEAQTQYEDSNKEGKEAESKVETETGPTKSIVIKGCWDDDVNGTYETSSELYNGKPVYYEKGTAYGDNAKVGVWCRKSDNSWVVGTIHHVALNGGYEEWYVASGGAGCCCSGVGHTADDVPPKKGWTTTKGYPRSIKVTA